MDSTTKKILFEIDIKDNSEVTFKKLDKTMDDLEGKTQQVGTEMDKTAGKAVAGGESMTKSITKGVVAGNLLVEGLKLLGDVASKAFDLAVQGAKAFIDLAIQGDTIGDVAGRFEKNFTKSERALRRFRVATGGTVTDFELMKSASQVASFGITKDSAKIAEIWRFSRAKAEELGVSAQEVFTQITTAVGKGRDAQLKELGLTTDGYDKLIKKMGESADKLTDRQKAQLLLNDVLVQSKKVQDAEIDGYEVLQTTIANAKNEIATQLTPVLNTLAESALPLVKQGIDGVTKFMKDAQDPTTNTGKAFSNVKKALIGEDGKGGLVKSLGDLMTELSSPEVVDTFAGSITQLAGAIDDMKGAVQWFIKNKDTIYASFKWLFDIADIFSKYGGIDAIKNAIGSALKNNPINNTIGNIDKSKFKQAGGWTTRTGTVTVGEMGREKLRLPQGTKVEPTSNDTASSTVNVNINGTVYGVDQLKEMVIGAVTEAQRNQNYLGRMNLF